MATETTFIPLDSPDLSTIDPSLNGIDPTITTQSINAKLQPFSLDFQTRALSINADTTIYSNLSVNGIINNTDLDNRINSKSNTIVQAPATITLGQPADFTYFVDANSNSYPLFSTNDIVWSKNDNNINLHISDGFKSSLSDTYARIVDVANITQASNIFLKITDASNLYQASGNYITTLTSLSEIYQTITGMSSYVTSGTLINNYATQLELSEKSRYYAF